MTNVRLKKVESIAEYSPWSILQYFWPALSNIWPQNQNFGLLESGRFTHVHCTHSYLEACKLSLLYGEN